MEGGCVGLHVEVEIKVIIIVKKYIITINNK